MGSMFRSPRQPDPINVGAVAAQANAQNSQNAQQNAAYNRVNQRDSMGNTLNYNQSGTDANGNPIFQANQQLGEMGQMYAGGLAGMGQRYMSLAGNMAGMGGGGYSPQNMNRPGGMPRDGGGGQLGPMGGGQGKDTPNRPGGLPMDGGNGELALAQGGGQVANGGDPYSSSRSSGIPTSQSSFNDAYNFASSNMEPRLARAQEAQYTRLRNQGLDPTSEAFKSSTNDLALQQNEARNGLVTQLQNQMFNQGLQGRQQQMSELNPGMQFANQAISPNYANVPGVNVGNVDIAGLNMANQAQQQQAYQQQMQQRNAMLGGLAGLGGSLMMAPITGGGSLGGFIGGRLIGR